MALATPYCTIEQANTYLEGSSVWVAASSSKQNSALFWGRVFIDSDYSCSAIDEDDIPDEVSYANALLAEDWLEGTLITDRSNGTIKRKMSKAGPVVTETEYTSGATPLNAQADVDKLLSELCIRMRGFKMIQRV